MSSGVLHSEASGGDETFSSNPARLRSTLAAIAGVASTGVSGSRQALQLREGLIIPRQTSLADARDGLRSSSAAQSMQARGTWMPTHYPFAPIRASVHVGTPGWCYGTGPGAVCCGGACFPDTSLMRMQGSQSTGLTATQSWASPLVQQSGAPQVVLDRCVFRQSLRHTLKSRVT